MPPTFSLLAISDRRGLHATGMDMTGWLRALGAAEIGAVQIREKDLEDRDLYDLARLARETLPPATRVLVNGRLDIALAAGADGAHLPAKGLPAAPLRARFGASALLGRSTHSLEDVERARDEGVDYVAFGPVYDTPGKGGPVGLAALARAVGTAGAGVPVFALGGVTLQRFGEVAAAGAAGVAAIRLFQQSTDLSPVARAAREHFGSA
ncbi:MAG TPA: thiamine phosphate synthase [Thermoanaerobaculia bacterium]|nr:thiamine phosphate synthase [Thermoanaerobaculia bacterium]